MAAWWEAMSLTSQIFAVIGIAGTLLLLIQVVLLLVGFGSGSDFDADVDVDTDLDFDADADVDADISHGDVPDAGLHILSVRGVISFFAIAGWTGVIADKSGAPLFLTLIIAFVCGFLTMLAVAFLMKWLMGLQSDGSADIRNAVGLSGTVYLRIPESRKGEGKVNVILQDSFSELSAVTDEPEEIPYGAQIVVIGITGGNTLIVKKK